MNDLNGKWTISRDEECFTEYEYFNTKEAAISFGRTYEAFEGKSFYIGQIETVAMKLSCLGEHVIEMIQETHQDDGEWAEDYLDDVKLEHKLELDEAIEKLVFEWATKYDYHPKYFHVQSVEFIDMKGGGQ